MPFSPPALLLAVASVLPQEGAAPPTWTVPVRWPVGARAHAELSRSGEQLEDGSVVASGGTETPIEIEVLRDDDGGCVQRWTFGRSRPLSGTLQPAPQDEPMLEMADGLVMELRVGPDGSLDVANLPEIKVFLRGAVQRLLAALREQGMPQAQVDAIAQQLEPRVEAGDPGLLPQGPPLFFQLAGRTLTLGVDDTDEISLASPVGGRALPADVSVALAEWRPDEHVARITSAQLLRPEAYALLREDLLAAMQRAGQAPPAELPDVTLIDSGEFVYDTGTGWPTSVVMLRDLSSGTSRKLERIGFVVTPVAAN